MRQGIDYELEDFLLGADEFYEVLGKSIDDLIRMPAIKLSIDGHPLEVTRAKIFKDAKGNPLPPRRVTIYDAATILFEEQLQKRNPIPILCHQDHMNPVAVCRVCVVEVAQKRGRRNRLVPACQHPVEPDMEIKTIKTSETVRKSVSVLTELLAGEHLVPRSDDLVYGENELEKLVRKLKIDRSRFSRCSKFEGPAHAAKKQDSSSLVIAVDHQACILCDRCIRGCNDIRNNNVIGRVGKGYTTRIGFDLDVPMGESSCVECGECMVSCPTGALTFKSFVRPEPWQEAGATGEVVRAEELARHPLFKGVSTSFLKWNEGSVIRRRFKPGEIICREGEFGSTAFVMEKGRFEVLISSPLGHVTKQQPSLFSMVKRFASGLKSRQVDQREEESVSQFINIDAPVSLEYLGENSPVAILTPDDLMFGEMTCMSQYPRSATVRAADDCVVLEILRNVLSILQRNQASRLKIEEVYRKRAIDNHLRGVKIFADLINNPYQFEEFVEFLRPRVELRRLYPGQVIFRQGDIADHFYMVRVGFVKVSQKQLGGEHVLSYIGPGGYFGEIGLLSSVSQIAEMVPPGVRTATCVALDHVDLVRVRGDDFREVLKKFPQIRYHLVKLAVERLKANEEMRQQIDHVPLGEFLRQGLFEAQSLLVLDLEKCTRCDECTKACADSHDGITRLIREGLRFDKYLVASSCRSCLDPYCMVGCPVGSIRRRNTREIIIEDWCIGCGKCAENCPYGNINMHPFETGKVEVDPATNRKLPVVQFKATTCDLCSSVDGQPSCVYACPHDAAHRMSGKDLLKEVEQK